MSGRPDHQFHDAVRVEDRIPQVLCATCKARNDATFNYCQHCGTPPARAPLAGRTEEIVIDESKIAGRKASVALATARNGGQKRKLAVSEKFDAFMRTRSKQARGWSSATNADVVDWLCYLDSHGGGTKAVHSAECAAVGSKSLDRCSPGSTCATIYAANTLDKGFASKLKCAFAEILGVSETWNDQEKRGNPVDSAEVKAYLAHVLAEQRRVGVTVQQARPMLAPVLLQLVRYLRGSTGALRTVKERVERSRDIALFVTAFHTAQRGLGLSHALAAQVLGFPGGEGLIFNFHFGKTLRESSLAVVVRRNRTCPELCPVRAVQEFAIVAKSMGWAPRGGYMFPQVETDGSKGTSPWNAHDMSFTHLRLTSSASLAV